MKKFLFGAVLLVGVVFFAAAKKGGDSGKTVPEFTEEGAENALILDVRSYESKKRKAKSTVEVVNYASNEPISLLSYKWEKKDGWEVEEAVSIDTFGGIQTLGMARAIGTGMAGLFVGGFVGMAIENSGLLSSIEYLALVPTDGNKYTYNAVLQDLGSMIVRILPEDSSFETLGKDAVEVDIAAAKSNKKFKKVYSVKVVDAEGQPMKSAIRLFGDKGNGYEYLGASVYLFRVCREDLEAISHLAVASTDGKKYNYTAELEKVNGLVYYFTITCKE